VLGKLPLRTLGHTKLTSDSPLTYFLDFGVLFLPSNSPLIFPPTNVHFLIILYNLLAKHFEQNSGAYTHDSECSLFPFLQRINCSLHSSRRLNNWHISKLLKE
jgi:hypothetical protein